MKYIAFTTTFFIISLYGYFAHSNPYADLTSEESHQLSIVMSKKIEEMTDDEILKIINRIESNIRLIVLYEIEEEGAADYQLGDFISRLYDKKRWKPLTMILKSAPYYPQSTPWIVDKFAHNDSTIIQIREKLWKLEKDYYYNVQKIRKLIENAGQKPSPERKKHSR